MGKKLNLIGQKFGRLTVLQDSGKRDSNGGIIWSCICDCGNYCDVKGKNLRNGDTKSCGCYNKDCTAKKGKARKIDLTGQKFGKWTVLRDSEERSINGNILWECVCECGNKRKVDGQSLKKGFSQSCGCVKSRGEEKISELLKNNNIIFESQKIFDNCRFKDTNALARFDFFIDNKYIIEYDGKQHFKCDETGWFTEENLLKIQEHDNIKNQYCKKHNIPLIRIPYTHYENICLDDLLLETSKFLIKEEI